ncbi:MAG: DoxX family protein [Gemmatimonadota bacterium]|nr:DoxX family protein [Gemmatimonadota bacterium]
MKLDAHVAQGILRIVTGLMFWQHGARKLFGWLGGTAVDSWLSWPVGVAGMLEFFGGILILLGVKTRWVAFLLCGQMAVTYWWRHFFEQGTFWPIENGGERAVLFCFIFLFLFAAGPGAFSVDGRLEAGRADTPD